MAAYGRLRRLRTDWFQVILDLQRAGMPNQAVARAINVPPSTMHRWKQGAEPAFEDGQLLLLLWCRKTGRDLEARPMVQLDAAW